MNDINFLARRKIFWEKWFLKGNCVLIVLAYLSIAMFPSTVWTLLIFLSLIGVVAFISWKYERAQKNYWAAFNEKTRQERIDELRKRLHN